MQNAYALFSVRPVKQTTAGLEGPAVVTRGQTKESAQIQELFLNLDPNPKAKVRVI